MVFTAHKGHPLGDAAQPCGRHIFKKERVPWPARPARGGSLASNFDSKGAGLEGGRRGYLLAARGFWLGRRESLARARSGRDGKGLGQGWQHEWGRFGLFGGLF